MFVYIWLPERGGSIVAYETWQRVVEVCDKNNWELTADSQGQWHITNPANLKYGVGVATVVQAPLL